MKTTTYEERIAALEKVLPLEVITLIKGHFLAVLNNYQINAIYKKAYPDNAKPGYIHNYAITDKTEEHLNAVEENLWKRACLGLSDWLHDAFIETEEVSQFLAEEYD